MKVVDNCCSHMEFLSGYGSDDETDTERRSSIIKGNRTDAEIVKPPGFVDNSWEALGSKDLGTQQSSKDGQVRPSAKSTKVLGPTKSNVDSLKISSGLKSRWATSSSFLAPVAYDEADAVAGESNDKEVDSNVSRKRARPGDIRQDLTDILPPPSHEVRDKGEGSIVMYSEDAQLLPEPSLAGQAENQGMEMAKMERETVSERLHGHLSDAIQITCGINAAPYVEMHRVPQDCAPAKQSSEQPRISERENDMLQPGIQFKEVSGASLRYDSSVGRDSGALRSALGPEYESMLRAEASKIGHVPKMAKKKHQLSALFLHAKDQEIDQLEKRATGMKSKAETQRKYGW